MKEIQIVGTEISWCSQNLAASATLEKRSRSPIFEVYREFFIKYVIGLDINVIQNVGAKITWQIYPCQPLWHKKSRSMSPIFEHNFIRFIIGMKMKEINCDPSARNELHVGLLKVEKMVNTCMHHWLKMFFVNFWYFKAWNYHFKSRNRFYDPKLVRNDISHLTIRFLVNFLFQDGHQQPSWILPIYLKTGHKNQS